MQFAVVRMAMHVSEKANVAAVPKQTSTKSGYDAHHKFSENRNPLRNQAKYGSNKELKISTIRWTGSFA